MRVPWSWLGEWVELRGTPQELCQAMTFAGVEVEILEDGRRQWPGVVTARLDAVGPHPNAERLTVTQPFDGTKTLQVVCGAKNHKAGDIVALATVGTVLPGDFKIQRSKIRGETSEGMLCSERELGLSSESEGILILPEGTPIGLPLHEVVKHGDIVLEASPTANRGDCLSMLGLAREISAVTAWPLLPRAHQQVGPVDASAETVRLGGGHAVGIEGSVGAAERQVLVTNESPEACGRYTCAVLTGVKVGPSPAWLQERLERAGVRSINNVVDATNHVMLELGNPLHAFDLLCLGGSRVVIRRAAEGEVATTLDDQNHTLNTDDLVIAGEQGVLALAGIMGGKGSAVRDETTDLLLESASFDPATVRRTMARLKIGSESAARFARGVDPELPHTALLRLASLLVEIASARWVGQALDLRAAHEERASVPLRLERLCSLLGVDVQPEEVVATLGRLGATLTARGDGSGFDVKVPTPRFDLEREVDLIEEVARLRGYDRLPEEPPVRTLRAVPRQAPGPDVGDLRRAVAAAGLHESIHWSFIDERWLDQLRYAPDDAIRARLVRITNPLSEVGAILRPLLLPSLLVAAARNRASGVADVRLFELRPVFSQRASGYEAGTATVPRGTAVVEEGHLAIVALGRRSAPAWSAEVGDLDFFDLKGVIEGVEARVGGPGLRWEPLSAESAQRWPFLDPRSSAQVHIGTRPQASGFVGRLAVPVIRAFGLDAATWVAEIESAALLPARPRVPKHRPHSRFPGVERDIALLVSEAHTASSVLGAADRAAKKAMGEQFLGVVPFDVFQGKDFAPGTRSIALRFRFRALDRTLAVAEVDAAMAAIERKVCERDGIQVRR